ITLDGTPEAYIGSDIADFLTKVNYTYQEDGTRAYIKHSIVKGSVGENQEHNGFVFAPDAEQAEITDWTEGEQGTYQLNWYVEKLVNEGAEEGTYQKLTSGIFLAEETYRLSVDFKAYPNENYNNRYQLDRHNDVVRDADGAVQIAYDNESIAIQLNQTKGIPLDVEIDWSQVTNTVKVYDGVSLDNTQIKNAITLTNAKDGSPVLVQDVQLKYQWLYQYASNETADVYSVAEDAAIHAGNYYFQVEVVQDDNYAGNVYIFYGEEDTGFKIVPKELIVTPSVNEEIKAGTYIYRNNNVDTTQKICQSDPIVEGYINADAFYFVNEKSYITDDIAIPYILDALTLSVYEKTSANPFQGYLRGNRSYNVSYSGHLRDYDEDGETYFYGRDYQVVCNTIAITPIRDTSIVTSASTNTIAATHLNDDISGTAEEYIHTITPWKAIAYTANALYDEEQKEGMSGNYFVIRITAPVEYTNENNAYESVIYENSIKNAGGYILSDTHKGNRAQYVIAFDASPKDQKRFEIIWEQGYRETFVVDFTNCILLDDMRRAVAPKSLAFNGASKKMTVGETQQLDLKITKKQMNDIICIKYASSDPKVLNVSDTGYVTALSTNAAKTASATVYAYAAY
ncbi:MAG: hypothetical protein K2M91_01825, partial [Lachnospiraceae bacterium]|nr:hypothetical protein [Lachnospiraceae bacterium]